MKPAIVTIPFDSASDDQLYMTLTKGAAAEAAWAGIAPILSGLYANGSYKNRVELRVPDQDGKRSYSGPDTPRGARELLTGATVAARAYRLVLKEFMPQLTSKKRVLEQHEHDALINEIELAYAMYCAPSGEPRAKKAKVSNIRKAYDYIVAHPGELTPEELSTLTATLTATIAANAASAAAAKPRKVAAPAKAAKPETVPA